MTQSLSGSALPVSQPRRYLALFLPWLAAERAIRARLAPPDAPFVLIERQRGMFGLAALSPRVVDLGLEPGLPLADARGRVPNLLAIPHDPGADAQQLDRLAHIARDFTPSIAPEAPQGVMLDITGCAHLHGGEAAMRRALVARIGEEGFSARAAIADTPDAARLLARAGGGEVHMLPLDALTVDEEMRLALRRAGFRTIGELAALPRAPLAARFGAELMILLDRLTGREDPHIAPHRPQAAICADMRFAEPIGRNDDVLEAIGKLAEKASRLLAGRDEGARAFVLRLHRSDGHVAHLAVETGAPTRDPALLLRLLRERIDSLADPLDPGFGYDSIDLAVTRAEPLAERQPELEEKMRSAGEFAPLLDRLAVRYGAQSVLRFRGQDSHVPERAGILGKPTLPQPELPPAEPGEPPLRPLLLFDPPQRVQVLAAVPDGPPRRFRWRGRDYLVTAREGPERIAPEWWRHRGGHDPGSGRTRDYYRVEEEGGRRFWLFRHGLYGRETDSPNWYVHGLFA